MKNVNNSVLTIDNVGRMVIPREIRRRLGLHLGSRLELNLSGNAIILRPVDEKQALTMEGGLYIHEGIPEYETLSDGVDFSREQRDRAIWECNGLPSPKTSESRLATETKAEFKQGK